MLPRLSSPSKLESFALINHADDSPIIFYFSQKKHFWGKNLVMSFYVGKFRQLFKVTENWKDILKAMRGYLKSLGVTIDTANPFNIRHPDSQTCCKWNSGAELIKNLVTCEGAK